MAVLLVGACGGGGDGPGAASTSPATGAVASVTNSGDTVPIRSRFAQRVAVAVPALVDRWGEEGAFLVVFAALDLGYSVDQVLVAAGDMRADGRVGGVEPAHEPAGLFATRGNLLGRSLPARPMDASGEPDDQNDDGDDGVPANPTLAFANQSLGELFRAGTEQLDRLRARDARLRQATGQVTAAVLHLAGRGYFSPVRTSFRCGGGG